MGVQLQMPDFTKAELKIVPVSWADVPASTSAGTVWMRPTKLASTKHDGGCDYCPLVTQCQEAVTAGGYCGCESVLVGEVV